MCLLNQGINVEASWLNTAKDVRLESDQTASQSLVRSLTPAYRTGKGCSVVLWETLQKVPSSCLFAIKRMDEIESIHSYKFYLRGRHEEE